MRGTNAWIINKKQKAKKKGKSQLGRKSASRGARRGISISSLLSKQPTAKRKKNFKERSEVAR